LFPSCCEEAGIPESGDGRLKSEVCIIVLWHKNDATPKAIIGKGRVGGSAKYERNIGNPGQTTKE